MPAARAGTVGALRRCSGRVPRCSPLRSVILDDGFPAAEVLVADAKLVLGFHGRMERRIDRAAQRIWRHVATRLKVILDLLRLQLDEQRGALWKRLTKYRRPRHHAGRVDVLLHQQGRKRKHVAVVVEAIPGIVDRELVRRPKGNAEQITNGVVVLGSVQATSGYTAGLNR